MYKLNCLFNFTWTGRGFWLNWNWFIPSWTRIRGTNSLQTTSTWCKKSNPIRFSSRSPFKSFKQAVPAATVCVSSKTKQSSAARRAGQQANWRSKVPLPRCELLVTSRIACCPHNTQTETRCRVTGTRHKFCCFTADNEIIYSIWSQCTVHIFHDTYCNNQLL